MKKVFGIIAAMLVVSTTMWAKNETIRVQVPQEVVMDAPFQVAYMVQGNGQEIQLKSNKQIEVLSAPRRVSDSRDVWVKGSLQTKTWTRYTVTLVAHQSGELSLPTAKIRVDGSMKSVPKQKIFVEEMTPFDNDPLFIDPFNVDPFFQVRPRCPHHHMPEMKHIEWKEADIDTTGCVLEVCAPDSAKEGETFCVSYSISAKCDSISMNDSTYFEIVGGPGYGTSWQSTWENGQMNSRFTQRYTYILRARKAGSFALPVAKVWIGNTMKESDSKQITILSK